MINLSYAFPAILDHYKTLTLRMDHAKLLDVLTSLPVSQSILPRAVCFATSRPASDAICSFIDSSGCASGPIRRRLFIDYIITLHVYRNISQQMNVLLYNKVCYIFWTIKTIDFTDGSCEMISLPVSHAILPHSVCFAMSCPANHVTYCYISGSG